ncbi:hypothetical protein [Oceaniferula marina]|nr:hypothetical protein [Oceaniferula marina]
MSKRKPIVVILLIGVGLLCWNLAEIRSVLTGPGDQLGLPVPEDVEVPEIDWAWFNEVEVEVEEGHCQLVSVPEALEQLDGCEVVVSGPSFACGEQLIERKDGYTITGFVMVPYFGMIDCCVGNPIPYFQWTLVVKQLQKNWEIEHKGVVDPDVVVRGTLRIERSRTEEGVFFLENAEVIRSADADAMAELNQ